MSNEFLTVDETAKLLRLPSKYSVYPLAKSGELPSFKLGNRLLFIKEQLMEHLKNKALENYKQPKLSALTNYKRRNKWAKLKTLFPSKQCSVAIHIKFTWTIKTKSTRSNDLLEYLYNNSYYKIIQV